MSGEDDGRSDVVGEAPAGDDPAWPVREEVVEYETPWFTAGYDLVERPDGERARYYWVDPADAVAVVATDGDDVVLVEEYKPRHRTSLLTCPGGGVESGESPVAAARRELREETGFRAGRAEPLLAYRPSGWDRYTRTVVHAADLEPGATDRDAGEFLDVRVRSADAALDAVADGAVAGWGLTPLLVARHCGVV